MYDVNHDSKLDLSDLACIIHKYIEPKQVSKKAGEVLIVKLINKFRYFILVLNDKDRNSK